MKINYLLSKFRNLTLEEIRFFVLCLFVFSLPFDRIYSQLFIIFLVILLLIDFDLKKIKSIPRKFWIFQIFFLLTVVGLLNTSAAGMKEGMFLIEKQLAILLMPLIIPMSIKINEVRIKIIFKTFTAAAVISICYLLIANTINYYNLNISFSEYISSGLPFNHAFASPLNIHAGYLSMFLTLAFFYLFSKYNEERKKIQLVLIAFLLLGIILLASRSNILVIILIILFIYPFFNKKNVKRKVTFAIAALSIIVGIFYFSPYLNARFGAQLVSELSPNGLQVEPRIVRWKEAQRAIQESPIIGHGSGSESIELKKRYWEKGLIHSFYQNYNSHNQFISITLKHGLIGLMIFLLALGYYFKIAIQSKSFIYLAFLIQIVAVFSIENVLDVNKGIFYFAFFNTLLGYYNLNKKNEPINISDRPIL